MNIAQTPIDKAQESIRIAEALKIQRDSYLADGYPDLKIRLDRQDRMIDLLKTNKHAFCEALSDDYGSRSKFESMALDIFVTLESAKYCRKHTKKWMRPENRGAKFPLNLFGAKAQIFYQPMGVVGIVAPWNFPIQLAFSPLANALSAGNRAMLKPSELTPATGELMEELIAKAFDPSEVTVINGGPESAAAFTEQKFDHMVFTGAPSIAKHVMRACAENLVPLTLELGGKCPVIIGDGVNMEKAIERVMTFKTVNAGQICLAPDYTFVPEDKLEAFVDGCRKYVEAAYDDLAPDENYTAVVNARHHARVAGHLEDAAQRGCRVEPLGNFSGNDSEGKAHKLQPTLVINPPKDATIMQDEIFGPAMPVVGYKDLGDVIQHVNAGERPLALYYFGNSKAQIERLKRDTTSGGYVVNDIAAHVLQDTMPLGGVGHSGMGSYHGFDGFKELSHAKAYYKQGLMSLTGMFKAPRSEFVQKMIDKQTS